MLCHGDTRAHICKDNNHTLSSTTPMSLNLRVLYLIATIKLFKNIYVKHNAMRPRAPRGPIMEKTVNPYDADWKSALPERESVARPTCIAVRTTTM